MAFPKSRQIVAFKEVFKLKVPPPSRILPLEFRSPTGGSLELFGFRDSLIKEVPGTREPGVSGGETSQGRDCCLEGVGRPSRGEQARLPSPSPKRQGLDLGVQATRGSFGVKKKGRSLFEYSSLNVERLP